MQIFSEMPVTGWSTASNEERELEYVLNLTAKLMLFSVLAVIGYYRILVLDS